MSPRCTSVSPGGTCVVLNFIDNALKHPGLAPVMFTTQKLFTEISNLRKMFVYYSLLLYISRL